MDPEFTGQVALVCAASQGLGLGDVVTFLASDRARYLTGATIQVDGGYVRGLI